ncbi:MAG TPA: dockerin type I domain-containing protein [Pseudobacteroides sp.]|uniref:dockerin type I domain-containing protein n=1 Tax=Pseudobacteroides sp. TaxID=1968840 RepID=UPI002F9290D8
MSVSKIKKVVTIIVSAAVLLGGILLPTGSAEAAMAKGDLNNDGVINMADVILLAKAFNSVIGEPKYISSYDLNNDSAINMTDVIFIASKFNSIVSPTVIGNPTPTPTMAVPTNTINRPWDWDGIIGTGQSLSVGTNPISTKTQPYNNLMLSLGTSNKAQPFNPNDQQLKMVPLIEPLRALQTGYPAPYPGNLWGETPHSTMANQITSMVKSTGGTDYITAHTVVGESGQGMVALKKGAVESGNIGRAYAASMFEVQAINRLAKVVGKTYGVGAVTLIHGETDCGNTNYKNEIYKLWSDYNQDIKAITGQTQNVTMFVVQQHGYPKEVGSTSVGTLAQWKVGVDYPGNIVCIGPNYQRPYITDGTHLPVNGYQQVGEKFAQVYYEKVVLGKDWKPLQPTSAAMSGKVITVDFHVPMGPLVWDTTLPAPNQSVTEWKNGKGFEVTASGTKVTISSVEISGNSVKITCASDLPASGVKVSYAYTAVRTARSNGTIRWGLLRDSDPFKGDVTKVAQPNFCVAFEMDVR